MIKGSFEKTDFDALAKRFSGFDAIIFTGGISPQLEGEEIPVNFPGFSGGDRTFILLPAIQTELMKKLHATGKPIIFLMMTGSAIATPWKSANIPAIVYAWYGGQSAGTAISDVIFGDYNPAGRLPVTFYKSDDDLLGFKDYDMDERTYRHFTGEVLYPFGFGLSYTSFQYLNLKMLPPKPCQTRPFSVAITNTGKMDGEEVMQIYVAHEGGKEKAPIRALKGFKRISLKAGESIEIKFSLSESDLSLIDERGNSYMPVSRSKVSVGGGQSGMFNLSTSNVLTAPVMPY